MVDLWQIKQHKWPEAGFGELEKKAVEVKMAGEIPYPALMMAPK